MIAMAHILGNVTMALTVSLTMRHMAR